MGGIGFLNPIGITTHRSMSDIKFLVTLLIQVQV
jgi:hypothetical protein